MTISFNSRQEAGRSRLSQWIWVGPVVYMLLVGTYFVARYGGYWAESDSSALTQAIHVFTENGRLIPDSGHIYANGYTYQSISAFLIAATGVDVLSLQQLVYPLLACLVALPAILLYREITQSLRGAVIGAFLLLAQPEFLFVILRSSHEKFTRALMLFCLFLLVRSINVSNQRGLLAVYVTLFYIGIFGVITSNTFIAHSFIFALAVALVMGLILRKIGIIESSTDNATLDRLPYVLLTSFAGVYLFIFYIYPPAMHQISVYESIWDQIAALFLNTEVSSPTNAYAVVSSGWTNLHVYLLLSAANWIVLGISFCIWAYQGVQWFWHRQKPKNQVPIIIWLMYAAFAAQGLISVLIDLSGALSSNAQQRLFPSISVFAVAIIANAIVNWHPRRMVIPVRLGLTAIVCTVAVFSVLKATNEPAASHVWIYYKPAEIAAVAWSDSRLSHSKIWTDFDQRIAVAYHTERIESEAFNEIYGGPTPPTARMFVVTDVTRLRSVRLNRDIPVAVDANRIYDNGTAEVYRLRPETPYQR
jgi:hypothetical protein